MSPVSNPMQADVAYTSHWLTLTKEAGKRLWIIIFTQIIKIFNLRLLLTPSFVIISAISLISTFNISPNFPSPKNFCDTVATVEEFVSHWRKQYNSLTFFLKSLWASMTVNMISLARNGGGRGVTSSGS